METQQEDEVQLKKIRRRLFLLGPFATLAPGVTFHFYGWPGFAAMALIPAGVAATSLVVRTGLRHLVWYRWFLGACALWALLFHVAVPFIPSHFVYLFTYFWFILPFAKYQFFNEEPPLHTPRG